MGSKLFTMSLSSILMILLALVATAIGEEDKPVLRLVSVVFRHGDRAPDDNEVYPNDPYLNHSFYPVGRGGLTNGGKLKVYRLGQELKSRYGEFLGPIYHPNIIEARSSDWDRTKMSLQLLLSGLYPPAAIQTWNEELPWQPIPAIYKPLSEDILFEPENCPKFLAELNRVKSSPEALTKLARFSSLMEYLETKTGHAIESSVDMWRLYHNFAAITAYNLTIPDWATDLYPDGELLYGASLEYEIISLNDNLKRLNGGMFIRKISEDLTAYRSGTLPVGRRIYLYSGHETNIGSLLVALGLYEPHVPAYASALAFELWQLEDKYFVKIIHNTGMPGEAVTKRIPGCEELCPLDTFLELMRPVTPSDTDLICVKMSSKPASEVTPGSLLDALRNKVSL